MWKYTMQVDGMMCGMCEAHVNDAIRKEFTVKKISSSHSKKQTMLVSEEELDEAKLRETVAATGYQVGEITKEPYKKRLFGF